MLTSKRDAHFRQNKSEFICVQEWGDENLAWSPADYNGIRTLRVPAAYVWLPDTFIFNK